MTGPSIRLSQSKGPIRSVTATLTRYRLPVGARGDVSHRPEASHEALGCVTERCRWVKQCCPLRKAFSAVFCTFNVKNDVQIWQKRRYSRCVWECCLLEVCEVDKQDFRVVFWTIRLPCKVSSLLAAFVIWTKRKISDFLIYFFFVCISVGSFLRNITMKL